MAEFRQNRASLGYSLNRFYKVLGLSKQAVHQHSKAQLCFDQQLADLMIQADLLRKEHPGCGIEKMYYTLQPDFIGRDRFVRFFMEAGYRVARIKNYTKTTLPAHHAYDNLIKGILVSAINQVVQSDISYFWVNGVFYYLVFITDVFSKRIVGYQASTHLRASANLKALQQMIQLRGIAALFDLIHHSDRGSQYIAHAYINALLELGAHISMGLCAQDNAYAERVNGIIKNEYLKLWQINSFAQLQKKLKQAVYHYNHKRIHNHLPSKMSPVQFENALANNTLDKEHFELIFAKQNHLKRPYKELDKWDFDSNQAHFCPLLDNRQVYS